MSLGNGVTLTGATLLTVGLSNIQASVGAGGFGISVGSGDLGIAVLEPPVAPSGTDSRYWLAITATNLSGTLTLGANVSASVTGGTVSINQASGTDPNGNPATPLNWTTSLDLNGDGQYGTPADQVNAGANIPPAGSVSLPITGTSGQVLVAGTLASLSIDGVITASASFALSESTVAVSLPNGVILTGATLLTVGLSHFTASWRGRIRRLVQRGFPGHRPARATRARHRDRFPLLAGHHRQQPCWHALARRRRFGVRAEWHGLNQPGRRDGHEP